MKIVILTAAMLLGGIAHGVTSSPRQIISQLGFSPLSTGPSDFELPQVGGGKRSLSSYQGQWIWITFWATWCAPCRHEMPTLEYLHQKFDGDQIAFLGVSIDQGATSGVEKFLQRHNITFPNLHDSQGEAASLYRATAVPTIYLISPDWKLVGLFRGGRNWQTPQVVEKLQQLINFKTIADLPPSSATNSGTALQLPNKLTPPKMSITLPADKINHGDQEVILVEILWPAASSNYLIKPPKITLPKEISRGVLTSHSESEESVTRLFYSLPVKFNLPGTFRIGPIELAFQDRIHGGELTTKIEGGELRVYTSTQYYYWGGGALFLLIVAGILWWREQKRAKDSTKPVLGTGSLELKLQAELLVAKRLKIDGKSCDYSAKLLQLVSRLPALEKSERDRISQLAEQVKYAGHQLSGDQFSYYEKMIAQSVQEDE